MLRTLSPGDGISVALRKLLQGGRAGESAYIQVCSKGSRQSEHQRSGVKLRNVVFYVWEDASLWTHWIQSFHTQLSYLGQPCFPVHLKQQQTAASCFPPALQPYHGGWQHPQDQRFGSPHSHLEARNHWWLWHFLFIEVAGDIFISQTHGKTPILNIPVCSPWDVTSPVLTCSWSLDLDVSFKVGVCCWEKRDAVFLILPKCSQAN